MKSRREYTEKLKQQLDDWNARIDEMEREAENASRDAREELRSHVRELKEKRDRVRSGLERLQDVGADAWEDIRRETDDAWTGIRNAFDRAASRMKV